MSRLLTDEAGALLTDEDGNVLALDYVEFWVAVPPVTAPKVLEPVDPVTE